MYLEDIGEFGLIERISELVQTKNEDIVVSIGDDAAAVKATPGLLTVLTSDMLIENIHFKLNLISPSQLGYKAMVANISDVAAVAGIPRYGLISLGIKPYTKVEFLENLYQGILKAAGEYRCNIIGGDTTKSPSQLIISVAVTGEVEPDLLMRRNGARPGDLILVTGQLGASAAGLSLLLNPEIEISNGQSLKEAHLMPRARVKEARIAAKFGATAMEDISDGLASEIHHICEQSGVGARIFSASIPIAEGVSEVAEISGQKVLQFVLSGGEDYELVITAPPGRAEEIAKRVFDETGIPISLVGEVVNRKEGVFLVDEAGKTCELEMLGYEHFR